MSSLIKKGLTRSLILNKNFHFLTPSFTLTEIYKYNEYISKKAKISAREFYTALETLFRYIKIINLNRYKNKIQEANKLIDDVSYLALALKFNCPIWSNDKHFKIQNRVRVYTTKELVKEFDL